jgi:NADH pyrophosphatase NudC (nudix superfamily)
MTREQTLNLFYSTWLEMEDTPKDRLIWRVASVMAMQGHEPCSALEHRRAIRYVLDDNASKFHYGQHLINERGYSHICPKCGGTGRFGYTTATCWGCSGVGYVK